MAKEKEKKLSLEEIKAKINKDYGEGSVMTGTDLQACTEVVSTGSLGLDIATGVGGVPMDGRIIEIIGWESTGKSTLVQTIVANFQKQYPDKEIIYVDGENSLDRIYSPNLGINLNKLIVIQLDEYAGEGAYDKVDQLVASGEIGLVIYDSYNALQPLKVVTGEITDSNMGLHAKLLGKVVMRDNSETTKSGCNYIYIGQYREKIGVMFGPSETAQGGNALKFYAHMRLRTTRSTTNENSVLDGKEKIGNKHTVEVFKNKVGAPFHKASYDIIYGKGIDKYNELIELGHEYEVLKKWGNTITMLDDVDKVKIPISEFITRLEDNPEYFQELRTKILNIALKRNDQEKNNI